jgi:hypothetical protein
MLSNHKSREEDEKFRELCALAGSGSLTAGEQSQLKAHLSNCEECREVFAQYRLLATQGISTLAAEYANWQEQATWDDAATRETLLARVRADQRAALERRDNAPSTVESHLLRRIAVNPFAQAALAACLVVTIGLGAYYLGVRGRLPSAATSMPVLSDDQFQKLAAEKKSADDRLGAQAKKLAQLQEEGKEKEQELAKLRSALRVLGDHADELAAANSQSEGQRQAISQQRDSLNEQLQEANQAYQSVRAELANLRAERDKALLKTASLEARIDELSATNRDQERRLKDSEQYLASDRDIRDMMGARKLYIADVFDVDSGSRTRKPFGRVFYTQGKSLIFYAFDLDRQPGIVNASTFQVWGQRETAQGERALPMNLGILYMDNESNRRWVMRFDDPKQLAEIDAVFVTIEPRGGSQKPTSKPFLYALLRNEVNHP